MIANQTLACEMSKNVPFATYFNIPSGRLPTSKLVLQNLKRSTKILEQFLSNKTKPLDAKVLMKRHTQASQKEKALLVDALHGAGGRLVVGAMGFPDQASLGQFFKRNEGVSPLAFRKSFR